mmetsp:Transcript_15600/g.37240  ORF Transcript_15600/g.37240 Transcript_15600/m.37240 type:complete len:141 (-) Transcript_15600:34-456(-)|eukprot:CAMPEP_0175937978 /NCGR_PEP_ID=MMETSP0108-20121206/22443_1 /TAXON_ID=195067 ORGANISM="Goniomonas pacifica, Strain CCMP1869" /NCGR_SAMPLE_ID=MMETSP0108 /ASSEMBLY_ACC=CAM_ASM_000204 /LENGTH=140 /DNA_ID=CAMNT_0017262183 /DNA_START=180 /DNA_END=599 /DNA_ORIENTATION=+
MTILRFVVLCACEFLQLVFVSSDKSQNEMESYMKDTNMPWLALPFDDSDRKFKLSNHFSVRGIPSLAVVSPEGQTVTTTARGDVSQHSVDEVMQAWKAGRGLVKSDGPGFNPVMALLLCFVLYKLYQRFFGAQTEGDTLW